MSLENEIALYQFGQGVRSDADLLDQFNHLDEDKQRTAFVLVYCQVWALKLTASEIEQALAECSLTAADATYDYLHLRQLATGLKGFICIPYSSEPPDGTLEKPYLVLLHLFKIDYQRRYALEKGNAINWRYWDLSKPGIAQDILTRHQAIVEEVYTHPSFRSEFVALAKLWHERNVADRAKFQEPAPAPERQTHFDFLSYDDMVQASIDVFNAEAGRSMGLLRHSVEKALAKRYELDSEQANRLVLEVIERHLRKTYNSSLF